MSLPLNNSLLSLLEQQTHRFVKLWDIRRTDGVDLFFTDHDVEIEFEGNTYTPAGGFDATAEQKQGGLKTSNLEVIGMITSDVITFEDLRAGRYREAEVTERVVDFQYAFAGALLITRYWIVETEFSNERWIARIEGIGRWLEPPVGKVYGRTCRYTLGDDQCQVNLGLFTSSTVTVTAIAPTTGLIQRFSFHSGLTDVDGFFDLGSLRWVSGANKDLDFDVKNYLNTNGRVELQLELPFDIVIGDSFFVSAGCDKTRDTCRDKFDNLVFHGGFPFIPGTDKMLDTPNIK